MGIEQKFKPLKQFLQKWIPVLYQKLRQNKKLKQGNNSKIVTSIPERFLLAPRHSQLRFNSCFVALFDEKPVPNFPEIALAHKANRQVVVLTAVLYLFLSGGGDSLFHAQGFYAQAQEQTGRVEFVYDKELARLAEILGALQYLHRLCGSEEGDWRRYMERLIAAEARDETRRRHFIAAFNRSYRTFEENYHQCTSSALAAIDIYIKEGIATSTALVNRYGH